MRHLAAKASRTLSDDEMDDLSPSRRQKKLCKVLAFGKSGQSDLESFTVKSPQQAQFDKNFALYMITSETPFLRANNPYLRKAIGILGAEFQMRASFASASQSFQSWRWATGMRT